MTIRKNCCRIPLLLCTVILLVAVAACSNEDKKTQLQPIEGLWNVAGLSTGNEQLNGLLKTILPAAGIDPAKISIAFDADKRVTLTIREEGSTPIVASYAYDDKQLALRFDQLPIPFNAFYIKKHTVQELILSNTLSGDVLKIILNTLNDTKPELVPVLTPILESSMEKGLEFNIVLEKVFTSEKGV